MDQLRTRKSFGLLEVLIAGVLVITVIGSTVSIRQRVTSESLTTQKQAVAYMLAEEGMEAVREIRENTYLLQQVDIPFNPTIFTDPVPAFNLVKVPWYCGLVYSYQIKRDGDGSDANGTRDYIKCNTPSRVNQMSATKIIAGVSNNYNWGDFSINNTVSPVVYDTGELGNGGPTGASFADLSNKVITRPNWSLSAPTKMDTGSHVGTTGSGNAFMPTDLCRGAERIFVRKGTVLPVNDTNEPSKTGINGSILENRKQVGSGSLSTQYNRRQAADYGGGGSCTAWVPPLGYDEYRRQVLVTPVGPTDNDTTYLPEMNESPGNLPATWFSGAKELTGNHMARVLVRVSWQDQSRATGVNLEQAVLLATYLSDWRPAN